MARVVTTNQTGSAAGFVAAAVAFGAGAVAAAAAARKLGAGRA
jgi:hypothetical protein